MKMPCRAVLLLSKRGGDAAADGFPPCVARQRLQAALPPWIVVCFGFVFFPQINVL